MPIVYRPVSSKVLIEEALIENTRLEREEKQRQKERSAIQEAHERRQQTIIENNLKRTQVDNKYAGYTERLRTALVEAGIFTVYSESMKKANKLLNKKYDPLTESTMHALSYQFLHDNGSAPTLSKLRSGTASYYMTELYEIIDRNFKAMLEEADPSDPGTFGIDNTVMDSYKKEVADSENLADITDSIAGRVANAVEDFIAQNAEDKNKISLILNVTKDKIEDVTAKDKEEEEEIKEGYAQQARLAVSKIRNKKKGLFTEMVTNIAEGVMSTDHLKPQFMNEGHIDIGKVVDKAMLVYGFLETVNTLRLDKIDKNYIEETLESLKHY